MAEAVARLADAPSEMAALRRQARAAAPGFSREALASRMLGVLQQVAGR